MIDRLSVLLEANDASLSSTIRRASSNIDEFGRRTTTAGHSVSRASTEMTGSMTKLENVLERVSSRALAGFALRAAGVYAAGRAVNQALQDVVGGAVQLDARMRNVNSISGLTEQQLRALTGQVVDLSRVLPQSANTLAEGLYNIASSGFQGAAGVTVLTASAKAATAGLTDTATAAQAISGVLNAYGEGAANARNVSDSLFQTVNLGVLSFADLAQGIGTVVGSASAAQVSIDQVGAAIATMTRAGVVPAEAFTALNQVLAQIIQPGTAMTAVFKALGYTSGAAALQAKGLSGVMADIRTVTGGNITSMSQLFTDIRSLRGALALGTNSGQLYNQMLRQQQDAHKGAGATATAFNEQMKAVSAQWQLYKNRIQAAAIETGARLLPALLAAMRGTSSFAHEVGRVGQDVAPIFHNLADAVVSTVHVLAVLASTVAPVVKIFAILAGTALIATLEALSAVIATVTGFFDRHRTTAVALALVLSTLLIPQFVSLTAVMARVAAVTVLNSFLAIGRVATVATGGITALRAAMTGLLATSVGLSGVLGGVFAGAAIIAGISMYKLQQASAEARTEIGKLTDGFDTAKVTRAAQTIDDVAAAADRARGSFNDLNRFQRGAGVFGFGPGAKDIANLNAASAAQGTLQDQLLNTLRNANKLGGEFRVLGQTVLDYAAKNNIDLSKPWENSSAAIEQARQGLQELAAQAGVSLPQLSSLAGSDIDAMQALSEAIKKATDATAQGFSSSFDVIAQFKPEQGAQAVEAAQKKLTSSQKALTDEEARFAAQRKHTVSSSQQLANAHNAVADAAKGLSKAQADAAKTGDLSTIYSNDITAARRFVTEINDATQRGLDPQEISRLLQQGPERAGALLDALVRGHSNRLIRLANQSEATLARISARAVEMARLTALAINAPSDALGRDLPRAMRIAQTLAAEGSKATAASLLKALHLPPSEITRIAQEFGITLPKAIQGALNQHPVNVRVTATLPGGRRAAYADGGQVAGPGTGTSDSVPAWLSNGEFVQRAAAVDFYGVEFMRRLNLMQVPRFADGGPVGTYMGSRGMSSSAMQTIVRVVEVRVPQSVQNITHLDGVHFDDMKAFREFQKAERRRRAVS